MTKQETAENELREIAQQLKAFGEKHDYSFISVSFNDGTVNAFTRHNEPDPIDFYLWKDNDYEPVNDKCKRDW